MCKEKGAAPPAPNQVNRDYSENKPIPEQLQLSFQSSSPLNRDRLTGQNKKLFDFLSTGNTIHSLHPAKRLLQIGYLNSRISDLRNRHGIIVHKRYIKAPDANGELVTVREYSLRPFEKGSA